MKYYLGPWKWVASGEGLPSFQSPKKAIGAIDLGVLPEMSAIGSDRKGCLCWVDDVESLGNEFDLLGIGDIREIKRSGRLAATFEKALGLKPEGNTLDAMVFDCLVGQSDTTGQAAPMSIAPSSDGYMDLCLQGHGRVCGERFEWGRHKHTAKLKRLIRREFSALMDDANGGKLKEKDHPRKVLDALCEKYGVTEWREFVENARQKDIPGRLPHETTISDNFNRADSTSLGSSSEGWSWSEVAGNIDIISNVASCRTIGGVIGNHARAQFDLSSADHYAQSVVSLAASGVTDGGPAVRYSTAADTFYLADLTRTQVVLYKVVGSSGYTALGSASRTYTAAATVKAEINGSGLKAFVNGTQFLSVTDTSLTGSLRTGFHGYQNVSAGDVFHDDFVAADLTASGILFTQLERNTRGINRGIFTGWGP